MNTASLPVVSVRVNGGEVNWLVRKIRNVSKSNVTALEEVVADHAGEVEAEGVLPRERPIVETRDIVFPQVSKRKLAHGVGYDFQRSAGARTFVSLVFLKLNSRL